MVRISGLKALLIIIVVVILSSCSAPFEAQLNDASEAVEVELNSEPGKANNSNIDIEYRLPFGVEKEEETPNNILLKSGSKTYILFYNQHEDSGSKVVYESTLNQHPEWDGQLTFEADDKFGYLLVKSLDNGIYQVVTGIGGVKVTTETKNISSDAATMISIANSVKKK
jgi:hypothetical protein